MKQFFLILSLSFCVNVFATVRTVSNNPATLAQFTTIQAAINASGSGDTIYVHGSPTRYAGFTITDKRLTIIGPGFAPAQNFMAFKAVIETAVNITGVNSRKTEIQGLDFFLSVGVGVLGGGAGTIPDSLRFIRNQFESAIYFNVSTTYNGYVFQDNWFDEAWVSAPAQTSITYFLFQNNLFYATYSNGNINGFAATYHVVFDHNLWYGPNGTSVAPCFSSASQGMLFTNNIFVKRNAAVNNTLSTFNKNITLDCGVNNPWDSAYLNGGSGNFAGQNPQMVDQTAVNSGTNNPLLNFTISSGPADNIGTDGKDLGLLYDASGILNWNNSRMSRLPFIYSMNISNSTVPAGGTLNVQVEARRNN
jgi:hypothetical protein